MVLDLGDESRVLPTLVALALLVVSGALWLFIRDNRSGRRFAGAIAFLATSFAIEALLPWLPPAGKVAATLRALDLLFFLFGLIRALVVVVDLTATRRQTHVSTIFRDLITLFLYAVVILAVLRLELGMDPTPLLATSALVTAVIGLALQETLGNVFSGLSLQLQKPFEPGDWIRFQSHLGRVLGIGWRSTRLVTRSLEHLEVPNALLARDVITNYRGVAIGDDLFVGVSYTAPPNKVKEAIVRVLQHSADIAKYPPPQVWVADYGDFAIKYRIRFWMVDYSRQDNVRDDVMTALWYTFRRNGIEIPYPIRTLEIRQPAAPVGLDERQQESLAALGAVDFLAELTEDELSTLVPTLHEHDYGDGEIICREGEAGHTFYVIRRGTVEVLATGVKGQETHVADLAAPAFFGEMSLFTGERRSATVRAKGDVRVLIVERQGFESLFQARPSIATAVSRVIAERQSGLRERREAVTMVETTEGRSQWMLDKMRAILRF